jgi:hypothetical protein
MRLKIKARIVKKISLPDAHSAAATTQVSSLVAGTFDVVNDEYRDNQADCP